MGSVKVLRIGLGVGAVLGSVAVGVGAPTYINSFIGLGRRLCSGRAFLLCKGRSRAGPCLGVGVGLSIVVGGLLYSDE